MMERDTFLDFLTNPYWGEVETLLARLVRELEGKAARSEQNHDYERGRLAGAERALVTLNEWRKITKKELTKSG